MINSKNHSIYNNIVILGVARAFQDEYQRFKFFSEGDDSMRLRPVSSSGAVVSPESLDTSLKLVNTLVVRFIDNEGSIYWQREFANRGDSIGYIATQIASVKIRPGLDHIQLFTNVNSARKDIAIEGYIHSNLSNQNFANAIYKETGQNYQFRVERDGLYAQYKNQVRIPDGEYLIETAENTNRVIGTENIMTISGEYNYTSNQRFKLEYNNVLKAYKIKSKTGVFSWSSGNGSDVINYPDNSNNDQFWYLKDAGDNKYNVVNASNINKYLNLDSDGINISVAEKRDNIKQQFKFARVKDKEISYTTQGRFVIASKLNNNKVLDINTAYYVDDVTIWDRLTGDNQKWRFAYDADKDAYKISSALSHKKVLVPQPNLMYGSNVYADSDNIAPWSPQRYWKLEFKDDGYCTIRNSEYLDMVLDLYDSDTNNGSNIQIHKPNNGNNQKWKLIRS